MNDDDDDDDDNEDDEDKFICSLCAAGSETKIM
jgi:hypothetical protein